MRYIFIAISLNVGLKLSTHISLTEESLIFFPVLIIIIIIII